MDKSFWERDRYEAFLYEEDKRKALRAECDQLRAALERAKLDINQTHDLWNHGHVRAAFKRRDEAIARIEAALRGEGATDG
jgi:hypothetical protein